jgi:hypothetical protein
MLILWFLTKGGWISALFPGVIYYTSLFLLIAGNFFFIYTGLVGVYWVINDISRRKGENGTHPLPFSYEIVKYGLLIPFYWVLTSVAAYKALWQLMFRPSFWEKTAHGFFENSQVSMNDTHKRGNREAN